MPNKAVLNTDAPPVTRHILWDSAQHATWYLGTRCCNRLCPGEQQQSAAASLHLEGLRYLGWCDGQ